MLELLQSTVLRQICSDICLAARIAEHMPHDIVLSQLWPLQNSLQAIQLRGGRHHPHEEPQSYGRRL